MMIADAVKGPATTAEADAPQPATVKRRRRRFPRLRALPQLETRKAS
jgi:hypothetical protein